MPWAFWEIAGRGRFCSGVGGWGTLLDWMRTARVIVAGGLICLGGCFAPEPPSIHSQDPQRLIPAIEIAVKQHDQSVVPLLVDDLSSDDAAVRLYSINGLRRLTGEDFGYRAYDDDEARRPAVAKWQAWVASHTY
jgi:hypothetical protein